MLRYFIDMVDMVDMVDMNHELDMHNSVIVSPVKIRRFLPF